MLTSSDVIPFKTTARRRARGMSIIETMLAFIVLLVAIMGLCVTTGYSIGEIDRSASIANVPEGFGDIKISSDQIQAQTAAQQYMDLIRKCVHSGSAGSLSTCAPTPTIAIDTGYMYFANGQSAWTNGNFNFSAASCTSLTNALFSCVVTVTWTEPGTSNQKRVQITSEASNQT